MYITLNNDKHKLTSITILDMKATMTVYLKTDKYWIELLFHNKGEFYTFYKDLLINCSKTLIDIDKYIYNYSVSHRKITPQKKEVLSQLDILNIKRTMVKDKYVFHYHLKFKGVQHTIRIESKVESFNSPTVFKGRPMLPILSNYIYDGIMAHFDTEKGKEEYISVLGLSSIPVTKVDALYRKDVDHAKIVKALFGKSFKTVVTHYQDYR